MLHVLAWSSRHARLRPQVQNRLLRLQARGLRLDQHARHGLHCREAVRKWKRAAGLRAICGRRFGAVPHQAKLFDEFLPEEELLPIAQAISRVFARLGEKKNRAAARIKFLITKIGIEEFRRIVLEERKIMPEDGRWTGYLPNVD